MIRESLDIGARVAVALPLHRIVMTQPYPLLFATIGGMRLHGFSSPDSDLGLREAHALPLG